MACLVGLEAGLEPQSRWDGGKVKVGRRHQKYISGGGPGARMGNGTPSPRRCYFLLQPWLDHALPSPHQWLQAPLWACGAGLVTFSSWMRK